MKSLVAVLLTLINVTSQEGHWREIGLNAVRHFEIQRSVWDCINVISNMGVGVSTNPIGNANKNHYASVQFCTVLNREYICFKILSPIGPSKLISKFSIGENYVTFWPFISPQFIDEIARGVLEMISAPRIPSLVLDHSAYGRSFSEISDCGPYRPLNTFFFEDSRVAQFHIFNRKPPSKAFDDVASVYLVRLHSSIRALPDQNQIVDQKASAKGRYPYLDGVDKHRPFRRLRDAPLLAQIGAFAVLGAIAEGLIIFGGYWWLVLRRRGIGIATFLGGSLMLGATLALVWLR